MLYLYNTMTRGKEPFEPRNDRAVKMFTCGPSIYRRPHIGNYRTFLWEDTLQRYLEYLGYDVQRGINFTDVEDKSIEESGMLGESIEELTGAVAQRFMEEAKHLRINLPEKIQRSSTSVEQAVVLISRLIDKGFAYWHEGSVFFDPLKFGGFGKLFRLDMSKWPEHKRRFKRDTYPGQRWNLGDFILWHGYKEGDTVFWDTGIGRGRPAWNVQDPAIISGTLGYSLDIFCGGIDNMYRHHDYNIAVMESASGEELARYWLHGQHVLVGGKKMSKSLDNIVYPENILDQGMSWEYMRLYLLYRHYRKRLNLAVEEIGRLGERLEALRSMVRDIFAARAYPHSANAAAKKLIDDLSARFEAGMNEDLDVRTAFEGIYGTLAGLHGLSIKGLISRRQVQEINERLRKIDRVLCVIF